MTCMTAVSCPSLQDGKGPIAVSSGKKMNAAIQETAHAARQREQVRQLQYFDVCSERLRSLETDH